MSAPRVSVIVPTYQRRDRVQRAVASVFTQTDDDFELIVVDDGSTDGTGEALAPLGDRLHYHWQPNRGVAAARNEGVRLARAPIVAFLDSDNRWLRSHLAVVTAALDRLPEAVLVTTCASFEFAPRWRRPEPRLLEPFPGSLVTNIVGFISGVAVRRAALLAAGGFDESLSVGEDADLWARLGLLGEFSVVRRRTFIREYGASSLMVSGRARGEYIKAFEHSWQRLIRELERSERPDAAALARKAEGSLAFHRAVVAIGSGRADAARTHLRTACSKLPELSAAPLQVIRRVWITLPDCDQRRPRLRYLTALAELWPDPRADTSVYITGQAFLSAARAGDIAQAAHLTRRWLSTASPGYVRRTMRARLRGARQRLDMRLHSRRR
jgi:glycosyltransferase involved in cell wall biosynthesis